MLGQIFQDSAGEPRPFRYSVSNSGKVHCFEPKALNIPATDMMQLRSSMFGAVFVGKLCHLSKLSTHAHLVWEAGLHFLAFETHFRGISVQNHQP